MVDTSKIISNLQKIADALPDTGFPRIVSCLVIGTKVIAYGFNARKSHPFQKKYSKNLDAIYWHSETSCIFNALKDGYTKEDLSKATLFVVRRKKLRVANGVYENVFGLARPCAGCTRCIEDYKIKSVVYSLNSSSVMWKYMEKVK